MPDFSREAEHFGPVCGLDEVGRGPLAGPVVAACVYIPPEVRVADWITEVTDSKKLSWKKLEELYDLIAGHCEWAVAEIGVEEIDEINILQASLKAMRTAFADITAPIEHALIDGNKLVNLMHEYNVGVQIKMTYEVKELDNDFWKNWIVGKTYAAGYF